MTHTITLKELRPDLPKVVEEIDKKWERYIVTKHGKPSVVMLNVEDYESLMETLDILADPTAMAGLRKGEDDIRKGRVHLWKDVKKSFGLL